MSFLLCSGIVAMVLLPAGWFSERWGGLLPSHSAAWTSAVGGALFGIGAVINGACNFGTIDKLGCGETRYLMLFPGLFVGASFGPILDLPRPDVTGSLIGDINLISIGWIVFCLAMVIAFWIASVRRKQQRGTPGKPVAAYLSVIGGLGAVITLAIGPWHYTRIAVSASENWSSSLFIEVGELIGLFCAVIVGAVIASIQKDCFRLQWPTFTGALTCFVGGVFMGTAILLIPGGNEGMIFSGIPSLSPSAAIAYPAMCATIAILVWTSSRMERTATAP